MILPILICLVQSYMVHAGYVKVSTPVGDIIGVEEEVQLNSTLIYTVHKYRGIPYAESPTGNLRFKKPVPKSNFNTAFDGTKDGPVCYQVGPSNPSNYTSSEDCLRLNIYVPKIYKDSDDESITYIPVMVWIHGGGFVKGEANSYNGAILSAFGGVIVVTINYRLNYLGFFTTGNDISRGNYGLWDQHLALKWVNNNIKAFHGDPAQVTLFGGSAGASSVIYQALYPGNEGLFKNVIAQSGSITSPWAFEAEALAVELSPLFPTVAGCKNMTSKQKVDCLRELPIKKLNEAIHDVLEQMPGPVFDDEFILNTPSMLLAGHNNPSTKMFQSVNLMIGYNSADGALDLMPWVRVTESNTPYNLTITKKIFNNEMVPHYVYNDFYDIPSIIPSILAQHEYTDWTNSSDNNKRFIKLLELATDYYVAVPTVRTALSHRDNNKANTSTYTYEFAVQPLSDYSLPPVLQGPELMKHGDEIRYVFGERTKEACENQTQNTQCNTYLATLTMWSNFAKTGNPNLPNDVTRYLNTKWPQFSMDSEYLRITTTMSEDSVRTGLKAKAFNFWTVVLEEFWNSYYYGNEYDNTYYTEYVDE